MIERPTEHEYNSYYQGYIDQVNGDPLDLLISIADEHELFYRSIPEEKHNYAYEAGKWSIKTVLQHIIDVERVMAYRALTAARNDKTSIPGFDHDRYANDLDSSEVSMDFLLKQYVAQRRSSHLLIASFSQEELGRIGSANGSPLSARAIAYILCGHDLHHTSVVRERYL